MKDIEKHFTTEALTPINAPFYSEKENVKGEDRRAKICESIDRDPESLRDFGCHHYVSIYYHSFPFYLKKY